MLNGESEIVLSIDDYLTGQLIGPVPKYKLVQWQPPPPGNVKINFDGALQNTSATGGYIIRDWKRNLLRVGSSYYDCTSIIVAEARALRDEVQEAYST